MGCDTYSSHIETDSLQAPYVGLLFCGNGTQLADWVCQRPPKGTSSLGSIAHGSQKPTCDEADLVVYGGPPYIQPIYSLPSTSGGPLQSYSTINPSSFTLLPPSPTQTASPSKSASSHTGSSSSHTGLEVGITVPVVLIIVAIIVAMLWRRRAQRRRAAADHGDSTGPKPELHADSYERPKHELFVQGVAHEKDGDQLQKPVAELKGTTKVHELADTSHTRQRSEAPTSSATEPTVASDRGSV